MVWPGHHLSNTEMKITCGINMLRVSIITEIELATVQHYQFHFELNLFQSFDSFLN